MSNRLIVLLLIIAGFGVLTTRAVMDAGYVGLFMSSFGSLSGTQIFFDLVILGSWPASGWSTMRASAGWLRGHLF